MELEPRAVSRVLDQEEEITREDFVKLATETKLTEFQERDRSVVRDRGGGERKVRDNYRNDVSLWTLHFPQVPHHGRSLAVSLI